MTSTEDFDLRLVEKFSPPLRPLHQAGDHLSRFPCIVPFAANGGGVPLRYSSPGELSHLILFSFIYSHHGRIWWRRANCLAPQ